MLYTSRMANQQLVDYINAQRAKGVSRDAINAALLGAGWSSTDVTQAMDAVFGAATAASVSPVAPAGAATPSTSSASAGAFFSAKPAQPQSGVMGTGPVSFQPKTTTPVSSPFGSSTPSSFSAPSGSKATTVFSASASDDISSGHHISKPIIAAVIVVVLLLIGGLSYWYFGSSATPSPQAGTVDQTSFDALTQTANELRAQIGQLTTNAANAENQLSIFAATTTKEIPLTVRGTVQLSAAKVFTLTTDHNILITIANSKDAKLVTVLTPLVGTTVELQGTHPPVSASLTVIAVNGAPLVAPTPAPTSTPATTPTPAATPVPTPTPAAPSTT
jgi:outer membrane murein-binding lipoprotein Lpp